jgi:hypothetical protein
MAWRWSGKINMQMVFVAMAGAPGTIKLASVRMFDKKRARSVSKNTSADIATAPDYEAGRVHKILVRLIAAGNKNAMRVRNAVDRRPDARRVGRLQRAMALVRVAATMSST